MTRTAQARGTRTPGIRLGQVKDVDWRLTPDQWLSVAKSYCVDAEIGALARVILHEKIANREASGPAEQAIAQRKTADATSSFVKLTENSSWPVSRELLVMRAYDVAKFRRTVVKATRRYIAYARLDADAPARTAPKGTSVVKASKGKPARKDKKNKPPIGVVDGALLMGEIAKNFVEYFDRLGPSGRSIVAVEFERFFPRDLGGGDPFGLTEQERAALADNEVEDSSNRSPEIRMRDVAAVMSRIARYAPHVAEDLADEQGVLLKDAWTRWIRDLTGVVMEAKLPTGVGSDLRRDGRPSDFTGFVNALMKHLPAELRHHFVAGDAVDADGKNRYSALAGAIKEARSDKARRGRAQKILLRQGAEGEI